MGGMIPKQTRSGFANVNTRLEDKNGEEKGGSILVRGWGKL